MQGYFKQMVATQSQISNIFIHQELFEDVSMIFKTFLVQFWIEVFPKKIKAG